LRRTLVRLDTLCSFYFSKKAISCWLLAASLL
jgi:hypothetical protein